tara:strand:- start:279 stop:2348 length:2070 start_codon:yes stop_codon:yes gene_type:complete
MAEFSALLTAKAEWKPHQIAKAGDIASLAAAASALAETVKSTLALASAGMEVVKLLATLQNINPLLIALEALADEVLKQIQDLKEAGYWYLFIDPYYDPNVSPTQKYNYGFEQLRNQAGKLIWSQKDKNGIWTDSTDVPTLAQINEKVAKPHYASPRKLIPGGYDRDNPLLDPLRSTKEGGASKFPQFSVKEVINEFTKAFDDEGDVPRYKLEGEPSAAPKKGEVVYDVDGNAYMGWDPDKDFGLELFDKGKDSEDGSIVKNYVAARKALNTKKSIGKPNIQGNTEFAGGSGAIAIIIAASDFSEFADVFNKFSQMFSDIPEFAPGAGQNLLDSLTAIITPNPVTIKLTQVDTNYQSFIVGDIIGGKIYSSIGEITEIVEGSVVPTVMTGRKAVADTDDEGNIISTMTDFNMNPVDRWIDMEVIVNPIRNLDGLNPWITGDMVVEMEERGTSGSEGGDVFPNYVFKGGDTTELPKASRIYPKVAIVAMEKLMILPDSTPPDFGGIKIKDIVPGWGEFFQLLENFVLQLKGMISDSGAFIQDMIDMIKQVEAFLEYLIKLIDEFLKFFQITLPSTGVYALYIPNQDGGNEGIKTQLKAAKGIPDLGYAAGLLFVGTEADKLIAGGGSKNPIDLLALVLGLLDSEDAPVNPAGDSTAADAAAALGKALEGENKDEWKDKSTGDKLASMLFR